MHVSKYFMSSLIFSCSLNSSCSGFSSKLVFKRLIFSFIQAISSIIQLFLSSNSLNFSSSVLIPSCNWNRVSFDELISCNLFFLLLMIWFTSSICNSCLLFSIFDSSNKFTILRLREFSARWVTDLLSSFTFSTSAPFDKSSFTISILVSLISLISVLCSAVLPWLLCTFTSAWWLSSSFTISRWPL